MVTYVNQDGIIREFGDIVVSNMNDGQVNLTQHLTSTKDNIQTFEKREASIGILVHEDIDQILDRLNMKHNHVISSNGILTELSI